MAAPLGQGVPGGANALPTLDPSGNPVLPQMGPAAGHVQPRPNTAPLLPLPDPTQGQFGSPGPFTQMNPAAHMLPALPGAASEPLADNTPGLVNVGGVRVPADWNPKKLSLKQKDTILHALTGGQINAKQAQQLGLNFNASEHGPLGKFVQIMSGLQNQLEGAGPGVLKLTSDTAKAVAAGVTAGQYGSTSGLKGDIHAIGHNYGQTLNHPIRQWQQDPASFLENTLAAPFAAARVAGTVGDIARAGEAGGAVAALKAVPKAVVKPSIEPRSVSAKFGENATPFQIENLPGYKSQLGNLIQNQVTDPLMERHLAQPTPFTRIMAKALGPIGSRPLGLSAAQRFGRAARTDMEHEIDSTTGELSAHMDPDTAANLARGTVMHDRHQQIYGAGAMASEAAQQPWRDWAAIKPPPEVNYKGPRYITPQILKQAPSLSLSEPALSRMFTKGSKMVASDKEAEAAEALAAKTGDVSPIRYVPQDLINSMKTYERGTGTAARGLDVLDRGTQVIRSGRFLTPAYAQWAVQNGIIHLTQAGAYVFRNGWQLHSEWNKLPADVQGAIDGGLGQGIARATAGGPAAQAGKIAQSTKGLQEFWHKFDDRWARRMSAIHELNRAGYHDANAWTKLYRKDPKQFRRATFQAKREAINYNEMTPAERATLQKLFTAYGWTRGATTFTGRFPFQHPIQAGAFTQAGDIGHNTNENYFGKLGGMAPDYLKSWLPIGGGHGITTGWLNPGETPGNIMGEVPGMVQGQTQSLSSELSPVISMAEQLMTGADQYGTPRKGLDRLIGPIQDTASKFKPYSVVQSLEQQKKGGTFTQGLTPALEKAAGVPISTLRNPTTTAGLGQKDYEQALPPEDKIRFQYAQAVHNLPAEVALYEKVAGQPLDSNTLSRIKSDLDNIEQRDLFQYHYANAHHAKTWKALPPLNKLAGTLDWMKDHGYSHAEIAAAQTTGSHAGNDKNMEALVNMLWKNTGIGGYSAAWKSVVKGMKPPVLTKANP